MKKINSLQNWLPFEEILENGILKLKNKAFVKILKITPINFNLKSNLEKEAILNSYKIFLKTCNFNLQILIQSNKEDLSKHISKIENQTEKENKQIQKISNQYIEFIENLNNLKKSSSKKFFIILKEFPENKKQTNINTEKIFCEKLNDNYFKIKECLYRCGNMVQEISTKEEAEKIIYSFLNTRKELLEI